MHNNNPPSTFVHYMNTPRSLALLGSSAVAVAFVGWMVGPQDYRRSNGLAVLGETYMGAGDNGVGGDSYGLGGVYNEGGGTRGVASHHHHHPQASSIQHQQLLETERKNEEKLQEMIRQLNVLISSPNPSNRTRAVKLAEEMLDFVAQVWGKNSLNYGLLLGVPIANVYEIQGDKKTHEQALKDSAKILKPHGEQFLVDTIIADKLVNIYSSENNYIKAVEYALLIVKVRRALLKETPTELKIVEVFCTAAAKAGTVLANAGMFKKAEAHFKESLKVIGNIDPTNQVAYVALEYWTNALHQQGKTEEAIVKLEEYKRQVMDLPGAASNLVSKILHRAAILWFTVDNFTQTLQYLTELVGYSDEKNLPVSLQMWCELATVYWELDNTGQAQEIQTKMKNYPLALMTATPLTRSKIMCTLECLIVDDVYNLSMRINRDQPRRKEGEIVEETEKIKRKVEACFLEITFEPSSKDEDPVIITQYVDKPHQFQITSPKMGQMDANRFYEVVIDIYTESSRKIKLGTHHQLVFASANHNYMGRHTLPF